VGTVQNRRGKSKKRKVREHDRRGRKNPPCRYPKVLEWAWSWGRKNRKNAREIRKGVQDTYLGTGKIPKKKTIVITAVVWAS